MAHVPPALLTPGAWSKLAWNVPLNGCTVLAAGADVGALWRDAAGRGAAVAVMREVGRAANADLAARGSAAALDEEAVVRSAVGRHRRHERIEVNYVPSTTKDFREGRRMEVEAIFGERLRRALANGVATPRLRPWRRCCASRTIASASRWHTNKSDVHAEVGMCGRGFSAERRRLCPRWFPPPSAPTLPALAAERGRGGRAVRCKSSSAARWHDGCFERGGHDVRVQGRVLPLEPLNL